MSNEIRTYRIHVGMGGARVEGAGFPLMGSETIDVVDARDVQPLVEAAQFMCRAAAGTVNARGSREAAEASRIFDKASDQLAEAVKPFASTQQPGDQEGTE